ncbi:hexose carrier [Paramyrothecium foliicola]|nr:hexose carrier [Paramyrothecium foliicola]
MMWPRESQGNWLLFYITFASGAGFALFGYDQGVFGALLGNESFIKKFDNPSSTLQGQITAIYDLGCFAGALMTMWRGNHFGSRKVIFAGCVVLIIGAVLQAASYHTAQMMIGRFVAGVGNGMNTASIPVWQSEVASAAMRGRLMVLQLALCQFGNVVAQWINYGMTYIASNSVAWRFPLAFQCFWALLTMALVPLLPDSPRWLAMKDRNEEAIQVIQRLGGPSQTEERTRTIHAEIRQNIQHENSLGKPSFKSLLKKDDLHTLRRVILGAGTQLMQQWSGINALFYYLPVVFAS